MATLNKMHNVIIFKDNVNKMDYNIFKYKKRGDKFWHKQISTFGWMKNLKKNFDMICTELGLNMTAAINVFARAVVRVSMGFPLI